MEIQYRRQVRRAATDIPAALFERLNEQQTAALMVTEGAVLLLAGAGTGKTTLLVRRIAGHIARGVHPSRILLGSFSRDAKNELLERTAATAGEAAVGKIRWAGTLHSIFGRLLRERPDLAGLSPRYRLIDDGDRRDLLVAAAKAADPDAGRIIELEEKGPQQLSSAISRIKGRGLTPDAALTAEVDGTLAEELARLDLEFVPLHVLAPAYAFYQTRLAEADLADFEDLILWPVVGMRADPELARAWGRRWDHIEIDEFQDTSLIQLEGLQLLGLGCPNVFVVGDDDQLLFEYAGAEASNTLEFERWFPGARILRLEENYRCSPLTLAAANAVIAQNDARRGKILRPAEVRGAVPFGEPITVIECSSAREEASTAAAIAAQALARGRSLLIAWRLNWLSRGIEDALRQAGVTHRLVGAAPFWERPVVAQALAHMRLYGAWRGLAIAREELAQAFLLVADRPARRVGGITASAAVERARQTGEHPLMAAIALPDLRRDMREGLEAWVRSYEEAATASGDDRAFDQVVTLLDAVGFRAFVLEEVAAKRMERDAVQHLEEVARSGWGIPDLGQWLARLEKLLAVPAPAAGELAVECRSLHGCKGSEYDEVVIVGCEEGILPHVYAVLAERDHDLAPLEAERRLMFVGLTRSRGPVTLTWTPKRSERGSPRSRFVDEIPAEYRVEGEAVRALRGGARPASPNSLVFAGRIARALGVTLPEAKDQAAISAFIDTHKAAFDARPRPSGRKGPGRADRA